MREKAFTMNLTYVACSKIFAVPISLVLTRLQTAVYTSVMKYVSPSQSSRPPSSSFVKYIPTLFSMGLLLHAVGLQNSELLLGGRSHDRASSSLGTASLCLSPEDDID